MGDPATPHHNNNSNNMNNNTQNNKDVPQIPKMKPIFVDMHENYDFNLLKRFYDELMIPNFPMEDGRQYNQYNI